ncbi:MAG TPA: RING finger protein [Ignavibacteria bacterium]|nr:RING finger protein [Ignavibacteria bacterium]
MQKIYVCPYCHSNIKQGTDLKICPVCETPHHIECWQENNGCTSFGCSENPETKKQNQSVIIPEIPEPEEIISVFPCPNCSKEIEEGSSYCKFCGYKLINISEENKNSEFEKEFKAKYNEKIKFHRNRLILLYSGIFLFMGIIVFGIYKISEIYFEKINTETVAIEKRLNDWRRDWEKKDLEKYGEFLSDNYKYIGADGKTLNKETKLKRIETTFDRYKYINIIFSNIKIQSVSLNPPEYSITYNEKYESDKFKSEGKTTLTVEKENGEYKIIKEVFK